MDELTARFNKGSAKYNTSANQYLSLQKHKFLLEYNSLVFTFYYGQVNAMFEKKRHKTNKVLIQQQQKK